MVLAKGGFINRTLFLVAFAAAFTAGGCHAWDEELAAVLARLRDAGPPGDAGDAGNTGDASYEDSGTDGGTDAGKADGGGCSGPLCLAYALHAGTTFRTAVTIGPHAFMAAGVSTSAADQQAFSIDGGFAVRPLPAGVISPYGMAGVSPDEFFIGGADSVARVKNGVADISQNCGVTRVSNHWYDVTALSRDEAQFIGSNAYICTWSSDAGFVATDLSLLTPLTEYDFFYGIKRFPNGERFFIGNKGLLAYWPPQGAFTTYRHQQASFQQWSMSEISGPDQDSLWVVGEHGALARWVPNGASWQNLPSLTDAPATVTGIWVRANDDVWVVGFGGYVRHWNGTVWEAINVPGIDGSIDVMDVVGSGADDLLLAGAENLADGGWGGVLFYYQR